MRYETVFFDLDGTIMESHKVIVPAYSWAAHVLGLDIRTDDPRMFIGPTFSVFAKSQGLQEDVAVRMRHIISGYMVRWGNDQNTPYPGMAELLEELRRKGCRVCICTNKPMTAAWQTIRRWPFADVPLCTGGPQFASKAQQLQEFLNTHGIDPRSAAMVGDRYTDMEAGRFNGMDALGAAYGYACPGELQESGATHQFDSVEALAAFLLE